MGSPAGLVRFVGGIAVAAVAALTVAQSAHGPVVVLADDTPTPSAQATDTPSPTPTPPPTQTPAPTPPADTPAPPTPPPAPTPAPVPAQPLTATSTARLPTPRPPTPGPSPTAAVLGATAAPPTAVPTTATSITPITGGGGGIIASPVPDAPPTALAAAGMGGAIALLGLAFFWRLLLSRHRAPRPAAVLAAQAPAERPISPLLRSWMSDLDDLADLAALTVPPEELEAARERRRAFRVDDLARRLVRSVEPPPEGP